MRLFLVVALVVIAGMYLWRKKTSVSDQENMVVCLTYSSTEGTTETKANDECNKESTAKVLYDYCCYNVILVSSERLKSSLRIAIWIKKEEPPVMF